MKISKTHQRFANILNNQRALSHPEEFLGPNWKEVLNFWLYLDTLSAEQRDIAKGRYWALELENMNSTENLAWQTACGLTNVFISDLAYGSAPGHVGGLATRELIEAHKILEQGNPLTFVPLFLDL